MKCPAATAIRATAATAIVQNIAPTAVQPNREPSSAEPHARRHSRTRTAPRSAYPLTSEDALGDDHATRERLLQDLLERGDSDALELVLDKLIDNRSYNLGRFIVILSRLDAEQADRTLIDNVVGDSKFAEQLYEWLTDEALQAPGPLVASFKHRVAAGESLESVARSFVGD